MNPSARSAAWAIAVVAVAGTGGFLLSRQLHSSATPATTLSVVDRPAPIQTQSDAAATPTANSAAPAARAIPERVPAVTLAGLDGKPRSLADFHDPVLVINFWATWCVPCRREIPLLRQVRRENHRNGVEVVGIAVDFADSVQKYAREIGLDYPLMIGEEDGLAAAESFGMDLVLPFTIFADSERRIIAVKVGELHADEASLIIGKVQQINAKRGDLASIRAEIAAKLRDLAAQRAVTASATPKP